MYSTLTMFEKVTRYLDRQEIEYRITREKAMCDFIVETGRKAWECTLTVFEEEKIMVVHSALLETVPPHLRTEMAMHLNQLNSARVFGNFELDMEEGDVRFKTYVDCAVSEFSPKVIERTLMTNIRTMQKYMPELTALIEKGRTQRKRLHMPSAA